MAQRYGRGCTSAVLVAAAIFGVAACAGRGGPATVTETVVPTSSASVAQTSATPSVSPINDRAKLCHYFNSRGQEIVNATDAYWKLTVSSSWSWSDEKISSAADHATEVIGKLGPLLLSSVGPDAPKEVADALRRFVDAAKSFADGISSRSSSDELNPLNHAYMDALDVANKSCGNG